MIKRILSFKKSDWKHVWWLFKNMSKSAFKMDFPDAHEAWLFIKLHFKYDSTLIKGDLK